MDEFTCRSEFGPEEVEMAETPQDAAASYAERYVDMAVEDPPDHVSVTVVGPDGTETEVGINIYTTHQFVAED